MSVDRRLRELASAAARPDVAEEATIERAVLEVRVDGRAELVSVSVQSGALVAVSSDGSRDGPHVRAAVAWLADRGEPALARADASVRFSVPPAPALRAPAPDTALADALDELVDAAVRVGIGGRESPSVREAIASVVRATPEPLPTGLSRFLGRLEKAMAARDAPVAGRLLAGAARLAADLRDLVPSPGTVNRIVEWLGPRPGGERERVVDRRLVEIGRETLDGLVRSSIERRYLVDVASGEVLREERARDGQASVGPCPRVLEAGLAEIEPGPSPRRVRVLQYSVSCDVDDDALDRIEAMGGRDAASWPEIARRTIQPSPALAEPFVLLVPLRMDPDGVPVSADDTRAPIAADAAGSAIVLAQLAREGEVRWIAGRLVDRHGLLALVPCACAVTRGSRRVIHRLR